MELSTDTSADERVFNMDIRDMMDLADVFKEMDRSFIEGNYEQYIRGLDMAYLRLSNVMEPTEEKLFEENRKQIERKIKDSYNSKLEYNRKAMMNCHVLLRKVMSDRGIVNIKGLNPGMAAIE